MTPPPPPPSSSSPRPSSPSLLDEDTALARLRAALDDLTAEVATRPVPDDLAPCRSASEGRRRPVAWAIAAACLVVAAAVGVALATDDDGPVETTEDPTTTAGPSTTSTTTPATTSEPPGPEPEFSFDIAGGHLARTGSLPGGSGVATMWRAGDGSALVSVEIGRVHPTFERDMAGGFDTSSVIADDEGTAYFTELTFDPADQHPSVRIDWVHPDQTLWGLEAHWPAGTTLTEAEMRARAERWLLALGPVGTTMDDPTMEVVLSSVPNRRGGRLERWDVDGSEILLYVAGGATVDRLGLMMSQGGFAERTIVAGKEVWRATFSGMVVLGIASAPVDGDLVTITIPPAVAHREAEIVAAFTWG